MSGIPPPAAPPPAAAAPPPAAAPSPAAPVPAGGMSEEAADSLLDLQNPPSRFDNDHIDLSSLDAVPIKKTLLLVNSFVLNTASFLNKFAAHAEEKLEKVSNDLQRLEIVLALLEGKLNSIPWIAQEQSAAPASQPAPANGAAAAPPAAAAGAPTPPAGAADSTAVVVAEQEEEEEEEEAYDQDERYARYFKMVKVGVPVPVVQKKMSSEGIPQEVIDAVKKGS